jgi:hypothetical protein
MLKEIEKFLNNNPKIRCRYCNGCVYSHDTVWRCLVHKRLTFGDCMCTEFLPLPEDRASNGQFKEV